MPSDRPSRHGGLLWKLLAINVPILVAVLVLVWLSIDTLAASYFADLMQRYHVSAAESNAMFLSSVHRYLVWTAAGALALAVSLSFLLTRRVLRPLSDMTRMTQQFAAGNYDARVVVRGSDELAELAASFNRMADALQQVERLRKRLVADVAHELRTPLTNVRGYLEALADGVVAPERATLEMLEGEVQRLVTLANDLLELARADAARAHLSIQTVDVPELIDAVVAINAVNFREKQIDVEKCYANAARTIQADPEKLLQAIGNLVQNAWQYTSQGGTFRIATERRDDRIRIEFSNDSAPIAAEDLGYLFERFFRLERSRSRECGGAGIGLAVTKELVEAHRGSVDARQSNGRLYIVIELPAV